jgi:hypothetical protein
MPKHDLGHEPSDGADGETAMSELTAFESALRGPGYAPAGEAGALSQTDQLARDIAEIDRVTAALRKAEPALETWTGSWSGEPPATRTPKPRSVWLLVGLLWLSTALLTVGAVAVIAALAG